MPRTLTLTALALFAVMLMGTGTASAENYTGCVTPGGTIVKLALGQSPAHPCKNKERVVHLDDTNANQHVSAHISLTELCKALNYLGASPDDSYEALGCHSNPLELPAGTVQRVFAPGLATGVTVNSSFDENYETCGRMLKIKDDADRWGATNFHWELTGENMTGQLGGAVVARTIKILRIDSSAVGECEQECINDPLCIGAFMDNHDNPSSGMGLERDCRIFHYSDSPSVQPWNEYCASYSPDFCENIIGGGQIAWFLRADCDVHIP